MPRITKAMLEDENRQLYHRISEQRVEIAHGKEMMSAIRARPESSFMVASERICQALTQTMTIMSKLIEKEQRK